MKNKKAIKDSTGLIRNCHCGYTHRWEHGKKGDPSLENQPQHVNAHDELVRVCLRLKLRIDDLTEKQRHEVFKEQSVWTDLTDVLAKAEGKVQ